MVVPVVKDVENKIQENPQQASPWAFPHCSGTRWEVFCSFSCEMITSTFLLCETQARPCYQASTSDWGVEERVCPSQKLPELVWASSLSACVPERGLARHVADAAVAHQEVGVLFYPSISDPDPKLTLLLPK